MDDEGQGGSSENVTDVVHPSNMEVRCSYHACLNFSYSVLYTHRCVYMVHQCVCVCVCVCVYVCVCIRMCVHFVCHC